MAQTVIVAITLVGIYYQFRLQRAATTFEQLKQLGEEWGGLQLTRAKLEAARAIHAGQLVPIAPAALIGNFCEGMASLIRHGHVSTRMVYESMGPSIITWWVLLEDTVKKTRAREHDPTGNVHFEWLAHTLEALAVRDEVAARAYDRAILLAALPDYIEGWEERIRIAEGSRAVRRPTKGSAR